LLLLLMMVLMMKRFRFGQHLRVGLGELHAQYLRQLRVEAYTLRKRTRKMSAVSSTLASVDLASGPRINLA